MELPLAPDPPEPDFQPYLTKCPELRFLYLGFDSWHVASYLPSGDEPQALNLSAARNLEELAITLVNINDDEPDLVLLKLIRAMLSTLSSPRFRKIIFNVDGCGFRVLEAQWDGLDALLSSKKFAPVAMEITIPFSNQILNDATEEEDLARVQKAFSRCDSQEQLSVIRAPFAMGNKGWPGRAEWDIANEGSFRGNDIMEWVCDRFGT
ncbi:hypothetical protein V5O48_014851 [Marasmius crinis-equi]|uniref:Uncharacterized protein n=1 Tax=Marasmius crinis-equi TaxID=585013 RepID=A0ABR3EWH2_9AGAR